MNLGLGIGLGFGGASKSFVPTNVAGCTLWLRADLGVSLTSGKVSGWADQSGTGDANKNASQGTAINRPTQTLSDAAYNNSATFSFSGSTWLRTGTFATPVTQSNTIFIVGNTDGSNTQQAFFDGIDGTSRQFLYNGNVGTTLAMYAGSILAHTGTVDASPNVACMAFAGNSSAIFVNQKTAGASGAAGALGLAGITAGAFEDNSGGLIGKIAEIIIYEGVLATADQNKILDYLGTRYGISIGA